MGVRRITARARFKAGVGGNQTRRSRVGRFALLIFSAGALSGVAALLGVWPFGGIQVFVTRVFHGDSAVAFEARSLFPPVPPLTQVIDVYDPAPPAGAPRAAAPPAAAPPAAHPTSKPTSKPTSPPTSQPTSPPTSPPTSQPPPPPPPPASFPVIVFPAGPMSAIEATCEAAKNAAVNKSAAYQADVERQCEAAKQAYEKAHP